MEIKKILVIDDHHGDIQASGEVWHE